MSTILVKRVSMLTFVNGTENEVSIEIDDLD